jgi:Lipocalin-like domain
MKRVFLGALALGFFFFAPMPAYAESDIVGSWKQTAFYQKVIATGERRDIFGDKVFGRIIYTKEGTFCTMAAAADRKQAAAAISEAEKPGLFTSMYAYCGKYTVDGAKFSNVPDTAWAPGWIGAPRAGKWEVKGKALVIETSPFKSARDGLDVIAIAQYERE